MAQIFLLFFINDRHLALIVNYFFLYTVFVSKFRPQESQSDVLGDLRRKISLVVWVIYLACLLCPCHLLLKREMVSGGHCPPPPPPLLPMEMLQDRGPWRGQSFVSASTRSCLHCQKGSLLSHTRWFCRPHCPALKVFFYLFTVNTGDCAVTLLQGWIRRFGIPCTITSYRGPLCGLDSVPYSPSHTTRLP